MTQPHASAPPRAVPDLQPGPTDAAPGAYLHDDREEALSPEGLPVRRSCRVVPPDRSGEDGSGEDQQVQPDPEPAEVIAGLTVEIAEIAGRVAALAASANTLLAEVETVGEALLEASGTRQAPARLPHRSEATLPKQSKDVASQAVRLAMGWIHRTHHHPLRAALMTLEGWTTHLQDVANDNPR